MEKYFILFKTSVIESLTYRGNLAVWVLGSFFWLGVYPFIWWNIYGTEREIGGMARSTMLAYFFFMPLFDAFLVSWASNAIEEDIKDGSLSNKLIKPMSYLGYIFSVERGGIFIRTFIGLTIMGVIYFFIHDLLFLPTISLSHLWLLVVVPLAMVINFAFCVVTGFAAFFTTRTQWFEQGWWMIQTIACGYLAPISFYPKWAEDLLSFTPFPLLIQTPLLITLGQMTNSQILSQVSVGLLWLIFLIGISRVLWKKGVKHLESVGI